MGDGREAVAISWGTVKFPWDLCLLSNGKKTEIDEEKSAEL